MVRFPKYIPACFSGIASRPLASQPFQQSLKTGATGLALTLGLIIGGCATNAPEKVVVEPTASPATPIAPLKQSDKPPVAVEKPADTSVVPAQPDGEVVPEKDPATASDAMVPVTVYTIDDQCNDFVEQTLQVHSHNAIDEAVGQAIGSVDYNAFKLEGYQVSVNGSTATVDMKLSPSSERKFVSLSSCEQRALFGSVEKTLMNNSEWNVQSVKFTDNGKEIIL